MGRREFFRGIIGTLAHPCKRFRRKKIKPPALVKKIFFSLEIPLGTYINLYSLESSIKWPFLDIFSFRVSNNWEPKRGRDHYTCSGHYNISRHSWQWIKSVNPKITRIDRQKRKNEFFLIWPKEPIWLPVFGNDIKRFDFLFFSSKFAKLENSATGPSAAAMRLEIWHMFNMLVWTYQSLS